MLSIPHMIVVFVIVLVVFGPQKLPELARGLGKLMAEFRKASTDFKSAFEEEMRDLERQAREVERRKAAEVATAAADQPQPATLATPSGAETQPPPAELATSDTVPGATEALVISPVPESVARSAESPERAESPAINETPGADPSTPAHLLAENTEGTIAPNPLDSSHDHKQPA